MFFVCAGEVRRFRSHLSSTPTSLHISGVQLVSPTNRALFCVRDTCNPFLSLDARQTFLGINQIEAEGRRIKPSRERPKNVRVILDNQKEEGGGGGLGHTSSPRCMNQPISC